MDLQRSTHSRHASASGCSHPQAREVAAKMGQPFEVVFTTMAMALQIFGGAVRSLDMDEEERKAILSGRPLPRSESKMMPFHEILARLNERNAA